MPAVTTKKSTSVNVTVVKKMKDYSQDPFFKKKVESAKAFLARHPLPEEFKKKSK
ncbi:MAG: hypothetical protein J7621_11320 [Niastella sp.]|nr:hypothetical protein [Niastella sp.]